MGALKLTEIIQPTHTTTKTNNHNNNIFLTLTRNRTFIGREAGTVWHSSGNDVSFWPGSINVSTQTLSSIPSYVNLPTLMNNVRAAWSNALGVPIGTASSANSQIHAMIGTRRDIEREYSSWADWRGEINSREDGVATILRDNLTREGSMHVDGRLRQVDRRSGQARIYVVYEERAWRLGDLVPQQNRDIMYMIILHEMGHALGYDGHAPNREDVMYYRPYPPLRTVLTPLERRHLRQIYDHFR